jgi:hypothetical protein
LPVVKKTSESGKFKLCFERVFSQKNAYKERQFFSYMQSGRWCELKAFFINGRRLSMKNQVMTANIGR